MAGSQRSIACTNDRTKAAAGFRTPRPHRGRRIGIVVAVILVALAVCVASASAVVVESGSGKALSYTPLAGASPAGAHTSPRAKPFSQCFGASCGSVALQPLQWNAGGRAMPSATSYFVYWDPKGAAPFPDGYESGITAYFRDLAADSGSDQNFYSVLTQYYGGTIEGGSPSTEVNYESRFGKALTDKDPYPATTAGECELAAPCVGLGQIESELRGFVKAHGLPAEFPAGSGAGAEPRIAYYVLLPPGVNTCFVENGGESQGCAGREFCAYHTYVRSGTETEGFEVFAVEPYNVGFKSCDSGQHPNGASDGALSGSMVHEHAEMITDPYLVNWQNQNGFGSEEVADICSSGSWASGNQAFAEQMKFGAPLGTAPNGALYNQVVNGHQYYYQQMWSNETGECALRRGLAPLVNKLSVKKGPAAGGTQVTINGLNFKGPDVTSVKFGAFPAAKFTVESGTSLTAELPPATAGTVDLIVTTSAGESAAGVRFTIGNPTITSVSPVAGSKAGAELVTVTGSGFALGAATTFTFGKEHAASVNCASTSSCTMTTPSAAKAATVDVRATVGNKTSKKNAPADQYTYN